MADLSAEKSPLTFFLLVYGLSIPLWIIKIKVDVDWLPLNFSVTGVLAAFAPLVAASILVHKEEGRTGVKKLFSRIFDGDRINEKVWYLPIAALPFLLCFLIYLIIHFAGLSLPNRWIIPFGSIPGLFTLFFLGAILEETGYMGYAIDPMQERFGALRAGVLIGILWAVWHFRPLFNRVTIGRG